MSAPGCERERRRKREVRASTINLARVPKRDRVHLRLITPDAERAWRPVTHGDCDGVSRPCPYVGCLHNLYLDVGKGGSVKLNFPDLEPGDVPANRSCALDIAERGGLTLEEAGEAMNVTRERIRQIESRALRRLKVRGQRLRGLMFEERADREVE